MIRVITACALGLCLAPTPASADPSVIGPPSGDDGAIGGGELTPPDPPQLDPPGTPEATPFVRLEPPIYVRAFMHFENYQGLEDGHAYVERILGTLRDRGLPGEPNFHRGEWQARWYVDHAPTLVDDLLAAPGFDIGYHPHPTPVTDAWLGASTLPCDDEAACCDDDFERGTEDLTWSDAVALITDLERCHLDFTTAELDCARPGGAQLMADLLAAPHGKGLVSATLSDGPHAVTTHVLREAFGIASHIATNGAGLPADFLGGDAFAYWYMGTLVFVQPEAYDLQPYNPLDAGLQGTAHSCTPELAVDDMVQRAEATLAAASGARPTLVTLHGSDKVRAPAQNDVPLCADLDPAPAGCYRAYALCTTRPPDLYPRPFSTPMYKNDCYVESYFDVYAGVVDFLRAQPRVEFVSTRQLLGLDGPGLFDAAHVELSAAELDAASAVLIGALAASPDGLPMEIELDADRGLSAAELHFALTDALTAHASTGALPTSLTSRTEGRGPIGDPFPDGVQPSGAGRAPLDVDALVAWLSSRRDPDAVPLTLAPGTFALVRTPTLGGFASRRMIVLGADQDPVNAAELTWLMARLYRQLYAGRSPTQLDRLASAPWPVPAKAPKRASCMPGATPDMQRCSRWAWYTQLQYWTAKRARWSWRAPTPDFEGPRGVP